MKNRQAKKEARKFLDGRCKGFRIEEDPDGTVYAVLGMKVSRYVHRLYRNMGWDGNHWDNPIIINAEWRR